MIKNYLIIAFRNIIRNKVHSFINIFGLSIGLAGSLLILVYVYNELSYENFHENRENIFRVAVGFGGNESSMTFAGAMPALGPAAAESFPEINSYTRFNKVNNAIIKVDNENTFPERNVFYTDSTVFKVFTFPLISGDAEKALTMPNSVVLSESTARKYFGSENAIGKTIKFNGNQLLIVTGVMKDVPENTQLRCDLLISYSTLDLTRKNFPAWNSFGSDYTYFLVNPGFNPNKFKTKLSKLLAQNTNENFANMMAFHVQHFPEIYLNSHFRGELQPQGNLNYIYLFSFISALVLVISCMNFMNLSTARSLHRAKEVGLRKTLGATRRDLIRQFLGESLTITFLAVLVSLLLFELFNPYVTSFLGKYLSLNSFMDYNFYLIIFGLILFVGLSAGLYPAFFLSKYQPVESLKGNFRASKSGLIVRKILVFFQNAITIFLIAGTVTIFRQLNFMRESDLGFEKNNVLVLDFSPRTENAETKYKFLRDELEKIAGVVSVSGAYTLPGTNNKEQQSIQIPGDSEFKMVQAVGIDYGYIPTLGLQLISGRNFSKLRGADKNESIIVNQSAVELLNLTDPVGAQALIPSGAGEGSRRVNIIGVVKDFHLFSFRNKIEPMFLYINPERYYEVAVKFAGKNSRNIIEKIKNVWDRTFPDQKFDYRFLSEQYDQLYESEEKTADLLTIFAGLAILIAAMGLFGLSLFSTEQRKKEIGIRKVLGASIGEITLHLSSEYTKWVLAANIAAYPLIYFAMNKWLENFAYRVEIEIGVLVFSSAAALLIAILTVSFQTVRAAAANPVDSLRYE